MRYAPRRGHGEHRRRARGRCSRPVTKPSSRSCSNDWSRSMLLLARTFVSTEASAEEVVQDTWLAVIRGIDRFEGRSSLRTWVYRILVNTAKKRGVRESRTRAVEQPGAVDEDRGPTVDPAPVPRRRRPVPRAAGAPLPRELAAPTEGERARRRGAQRRVRDGDRRAARPAAHRDHPARRAWATPPTRCARCSSCPAPTSGCCCTGPGPRSATHLASYLGREAATRRGA